MSDQPEPPVPYSGGWWEDQTPAELHRLKRGSFPGGKAFDGAVAELERRAKERRDMRTSNIAFWGMVAAVIAAVASIAGLFVKG